MTRRHFDWLIVGAGFTGAVLAECIARGLDKRVLVIDRRPHVAGNAFDGCDEQGVQFHRYGPHIFHTNSGAAFEYLSRFTRWRAYEHRVMAMIDDRLVPVPFNLTSLDLCFAPGPARRLADRLIQTYGLNARVPILTMRQSKDGEVRDLADFIYGKVFLNYTIKQWGLVPEELDPSVTARVPVCIGRDDRYFQDAYQALPEAGYQALFGKLLSSDRITVATSEDFFSIGSDITYDRLVFTGPIDAFFAYDLGALPYRSVSFDFQTIGPDRYQPVATVNYPDTMAFTRVTDQRYLTGHRLQRSLLTLEHPQPHVAGVTEPYYPIPKAENRALHASYLAKAALEAPNVIFAGRLGDYRYYNMDQAVGRALSTFRKRILPLHGVSAAIQMA